MSGEATHNIPKTTISVGGMTCAACVRRVELALKAVDGVKDAVVNLTTARATVIHGPKWADVEVLKKSVSDAGYEFLGVFGTTQEDPAEAARALVEKGWPAESLPTVRTISNILRNL